jgi:hypothetical protein
MAPRKKPSRAAASADAPEQGVTALDKLAGVIALIATRRMDKDAAALALDAIGFSAKEIAGLLDVGTNYVNVARHRKAKGR